ncbi:MAG: ROK family protein [Actinomyces sp.]
MALSIGVDVGGTKIAAGVVDEDGAVLATLHRRSPATARNAIFTTIADVVNELAVHYDAPTIGVGAAGFTSSDRNTMVHGTNLDWTGARIADEVAERTGKRVVVENDANAAAGKANVLVITLGTGVGGAVIIDGRLVRGAAGFAAEVGHITIVPDGRPCGCGLRGCLERYGSGTALGVNGWELATFRPDYAARIIELSGGDANRISGKAVTAAAREDDPAALECYARLGDALGIGLADLCAVLDPEVIVLAGGLTEAGDILLTPVRKSFTQHLTARIHRPAIPGIISSAGQEAGLIGAADLARQD